MRRHRHWRLDYWGAVLLCCLIGCSDQAGPEPASEDTGVHEDGGPDTNDEAQWETPPMREPGQRAPRTGFCDAADSTRCLLPWPSDVFAAADPGTETGLHLTVTGPGFPDHDDPAALTVADGHSRLSPIVTAFAGEVEAASLETDGQPSLRVLVSEPSQRLGLQVPTRVQLVTSNQGPIESTLIAFPQIPMAASTEHIVVIMDDIRVDGHSAERSRHTALALGLQTPASLDEAQLHAYHHPSRLALQAGGIDPSHVVRMFSFTTRSTLDHTKPYRVMRTAMLGALEAGEVQVEFDEIEAEPQASIALIATGRLTNLPRFVDPDQGGLRYDQDDNIVPVGVRDAPFRVVVPAGDGDYRYVMYSHGLGGDVTDPAFDQVISEAGAGKIGIQFDGWSEETIIGSVEHFGAAVMGSNRVGGRLVEGLAMGSAIQRALAGELGEQLAGPEINEIDNPAQGRLPLEDKAVWAGGSLGGVMGMVYASAEDSIEAAVLNVPGAGFTHFLRFSQLYQVLDLLFQVYYGSPTDIALALAMAQVNLDMADGGAWADVPERRPALLIQESIGDPVLPNIGTELAAAAAGAVHLGEVLVPVESVTSADQAVGVSALTQYKVPPESPLAIHGFADRDTEAGRAAQEQIRDFILSHWSGQTTIRLASGCVMNDPAGSCDFSE